LLTLYQPDSSNWSVIPESVVNENNDLFESTSLSSKVTKSPQIQDLLDPQKRKLYPKRNNMGECHPMFGKIAIFVAFAESSYKT
jgi:hypothetical protein